ncbi:hypothetical protein I6A94_38880 [Frankia sp. CN4]|nr:hypothetical protein [Frankia nepalensis]
MTELAARVAATHGVVRVDTAQSAGATRVGGTGPGDGAPGLAGVTLDELADGLIDAARGGDDDVALVVVERERG